MGGGALPVLAGAVAGADAVSTGADSVEDGGCFSAGAWTRGRRDVLFP